MARTRCDGERGATLIEFALILPIVVMLLVGVVSAAGAYQKDLSLSNGAREGARYGATLPVANFATATSPIDAWLDDVANTAVHAVDDGLPSGTSGRTLCVAYVYPSGTDTNDQTTKRFEDASGQLTYSTGSAATCFTDSRPATERRVQVVLTRGVTLDAYLFKTTVTLTGKSVARFEAIAG